MKEKEELIDQFFRAFSEKDGLSMKNCYHNDSMFKDEVFELEGKDAIGKMWIMLCSRAKDFSLEYGNIRVKGESVTAEWKARYLFSKTGRIVVNSIKSEFRFKDGLIYRHTDSFNFWKWSAMALGLPGYLLGWSGFLRNRVRKEAQSGLRNFSENN